MLEAPGPRGWPGSLLRPSLDPGLRIRVPSKFWPPGLQALLWQRYSIWPPKAGLSLGFSQLFSKVAAETSCPHFMAIILIDKDPGLAILALNSSSGQGKHLTQQMLRPNLVAEWSALARRPK